MPRLITAATIDELPALQGLEHADRQHVLHDAERLYGYVRRTETRGTTLGTGEDDLRKWAEGEGLGVDRVNAALDVLQALDRVYRVASATEQETAAAAAAASPTPTSSASTAKAK